ncbi:MAG: DUF6689 family protein [Dokdonella sp.]
MPVNLPRGAHGRYAFRIPLTRNGENPSNGSLHTNSFRFCRELGVPWNVHCNRKRLQGREQGRNDMLKTIRGWICALALLLGMAGMREAAATVVVDIEGNVAHAQISLQGTNGVTYDGDVTITFDSPLNLTAESLNLTAQLVDPNDPTLRLRLPNLLGIPSVSIDPAFPVMITVEPPGTLQLFTSSFDGPEDGSGILSFINTYEFELHTHDLPCSADSPYRLFKAPLDGNFNDVTSAVVAGSVRMRGRGGAFSQFLPINDPRAPLVLALQKILDLDTRILVAALDDLLRGDLLGLLGKVNALLLLDIDAAIAALDDLIGTINADAGTEIANVWNALHDVTNDAGEMLSLAETLRFTLVRLQGTTDLCQ